MDFIEKPLTTKGHRYALFKVTEAWCNQWLASERYDIEPDFDEIEMREVRCGHEVAGVRDYLRFMLKDEHKHLDYYGQTSEDVVNVAYRVQICQRKAMQYVDFLPHIKWSGAAGTYASWMLNGHTVHEIHHKVQRMVNELGINRFVQLTHTTQVNPNDDIVELLGAMRKQSAGEKHWHALALELERNLPVSRFQRDLSNSTRMRNLGLIFDEFEKEKKEEQK